MHRLMPLALLLALPLAAHAQSADYDIFNNEGLQADGYIDFADLPTAPLYPAGTASAPFTATLPVHGVPGLTVQVNISPLNLITSVPLPGAHIYDTLPGSITFGGVGQLNLHFNTPIQGISAESYQVGRQPTFSLSPDNGLDQPYRGLFQDSLTSNNPRQYGHLFPLEIIDKTKAFQDVYIPLSSTGSVPQSISLYNVRVQSANAAANAAANAEAQVAADGLQMWLRSEDIYLNTWPDHSGHGHNAAPAPGGFPVGVNDGVAFQPAYVFGSRTVQTYLNPGYFTFNLPINGWTAMTVFLVAKSNTDTDNYASMNAGIFWNEDAQWGNTFVSPYQTHAAFRFGTTQVGNQPTYTRPTDVGEDFTITRAVHNQTTDTLYVDGVPVLTQSGKYASLNGTTGAGTIGLGLNNSPFYGEISEILVYNRVLTEREATSIEKYLRTKFRTP